MIIFSKILCYSSILYCILLFLFFVINLFFKIAVSKKSFSIILFFLTISLTIISYHLQGTPGMDLSRYFIMLDELSSQSLGYAFSTFQYNSTPITTLLFFCVAKSGYYNLLPATSTLITMLVLSYILVDMYGNSNNDFHNFSYLFLFFFAFTSFIAILTSVRFLLAASFITLAIYKDIYKKSSKFVLLLLYCIPVLIHVGTLLILFIRVVSLIFKTKHNFVFIFSWLFLIFVSQILKLTSLDFIKPIIDQLDIYVLMKDFDIRELVVNSLALFILLIINVFNFNTYKKNSIKNNFIIKNNKVRNLSQSLLFFSLGLFFSPNLQGRLMFTTICLNLPIVNEYLHTLVGSNVDFNIGINKRYVKLLFQIVFVIAIVGMFLYQSAGWKAWNLVF